MAYPRRGNLARFLTHYEVDLLIRAMTHAFPSRPEVNEPHAKAEYMNAADSLMPNSFFLAKMGRTIQETSRRLSCDCSVVHWHEHPNGEPLSIGRKTRTIPPAIRRALQRRDDGCRFPGCTCTRFVDAHHIVHWADGGETSMENLVLLCRRHHRLVHEEGFGVQSSLSNDIRFTLPGGKVIPPCPEPSFRGNVVELKTRNRQLGLNITPKTPVPSWLGERMDYSIAVEGLLQRD